MTQRRTLAQQLIDDPDAAANCLPPRTKLLRKAQARQAAQSAAPPPTRKPSLKERVTRLEAEDKENWKLLTQTLHEAMLTALDPDISNEVAEEQNHDPNLPAIEDKRSFVLYVAIVTRQLAQKRITAAEARAMLYAAQLAYAALKGTDPDVVKPSAALPQLP